MTVTRTPLIYPVDDGAGVKLRVVEYDGDTKIEREWPLHADKAVTLGLELARLGWRRKGPEVVP